MDWQILAALAICAASLFAFVLIGSGDKRPLERDDFAEPEDNGRPIQTRIAAPQVSDDLIARFAAALEETR